MFSSFVINPGICAEEMSWYLKERSFRRFPPEFCGTQVLIIGLKSLIFVGYFSQSFLPHLETILKEKNARKVVLFLPFISNIFIA